MSSAITILFRFEGQNCYVHFEHENDAVDWLIDKTVRHGIAPLSFWGPGGEPIKDMPDLAAIMQQEVIE